MNLLEHYIKEVNSVEDVSNQFKERHGYSPCEPLLRVDLTCDCYGRIERETWFFLESEWKDKQKKGYFLA